MRSSARRLGVVVTGATIWIAALFAPTVAAEPAGATFLDDAPIADKVTPGTPYTIPVLVLNGSAEPVKFTLSVVGVTQPPEASLLPLSPSPGPAGVLDRSGVVDAGMTWATELILNVPAGQSGSYSGRLVVYASDGSIARRDFTLAIEDPSSPPSGAPCPSPSSDPVGASPSVTGSSSTIECPSPVPGAVLAEPFPATVTVAVERSPMSDGAAPAAALPVDPALASKLVPAALTSDSGEVAAMTISDAGVVTLVGRGPGAYKGKLARAAIADEKAPVALTDLVLNVRDGPGLAVLLLAIGLGLAILVEWFSTDWLPGRRLDARLSELERDAATARSNHEAVIAGYGTDWPGADTEPPRIEGEPDALLTKGIASAAKDFDDSASLDVRTSRWGIAGTEFVKLVAFLVAYRAAIASRETIAEDWQTFSGLMPQIFEGDLAGSGLRKEVAETLVGSLIRDESALNAIKARVEGLDKRVAQLVPLAEMLERMRMLDPDDAGYQLKIDALWRRLARLESGLLGDIAQVQTEALALRLEKLKSIDQGRLDLLAESASSVPPLTEPRVSAVTPDVAALKPPGELRDALQAWNWLFFVILVPLVVLVGLSALYFGKPTFGTIADYAAIFVWGFVGVTGGTLIKAAAGSFGAILPRH